MSSMINMFNRIEEIDSVDLDGVVAIEEQRLDNNNSLFQVLTTGNLRPITATSRRFERPSVIRRRTFSDDVNFLS